jgi:hypothetical protein
MFSLAIGYGLSNIGLAFAGSDQTSQTTLDVISPRIFANVETLIFMHQAYMRKANHCLIIPSGNIKRNVCARPLGFIFAKVKVILHEVGAWITSSPNACGER